MDSERYTPDGLLEPRERGGSGPPVGPLIEVGQSLGHYRVVGHLGRGGMGEVWEAEDTTLKRRVALKVLPPQVAGSRERLERFQREAEAVAALNHPNIVTIYSVEQAIVHRPAAGSSSQQPTSGPADAGGHGATVEETVHFLTMERVEGRTLAALLPKRGFELERFFELAVPLAAAVAAAHEKGITHRDLKPSNVMVTDEGQLKVLDFGLAKFQGDDSRMGASQLPTEGLTREGVTMGTASYMSPEQAEGKPLDARTDIFSLGVVLYEMATGERPFRGDNPVALLSSILREVPERIEALKSKWPRQLSRIVCQCLEKRPEARFQTAQDVYNQLRSLRNEVVVEGSAGQRPALPPPAAAARPRRLWLGLATLAAVLSLAFLGWWLVPGSELAEPPAPSGPSGATSSDGLPMIAVLPFENLGPSEEEYFAAGMTEEITSRLAGVNGLGVISRTSVIQYDRGGKTIPQIGAELGVDYILEGTVRWAHSAELSNRVRITPQLIRVIDDTHLWADSYDRLIEDIFTVQSEIAQNVLDQLGITLRESQHATPEGRGTKNLEAYDSYLRGGEYLLRAGKLYHREDLQRAIQLYNKAVELDPGFALAHAKLATAHGQALIWYYDSTEERRQQVRDSAERALELAPDLPEGHLALGYYFRSGLEYDLALREYELAERGRPGDSQVVQAIGELHWFMGQTDKAIASYKRASSLDPQRAELYCSTGGVYRMTGEFAEAEEYHKRTISIQPDRACPYFCLAFIYLNSEGPERARSFLESLPETVGLEEFPPINYTWLLLDMIDGHYEDGLQRLQSGAAEVYDWQQFYYSKAQLRGQLYRLMGRAELARQSFDEARKLLEARLGERRGDARIHSALGIAYAGLGQKEEAVREGRRGVELLPVEKDFFAGPYRLKEMAQIYVMVGDTEAALNALEVLLSVPSEMGLIEIALDPTWAPLRDNPRFQALLKKYEKA
ncbi:MAG: protein kinase [Acidobacteriota bacterium]